MLQNVLVIGALTVSGWCIWVRRKSWRCKQDAALTLAVALIALGLLLTIPQQGLFFGRFLFYLTGVAHLRDYAGHLSFMSAVAAVSYSVASRLVPDDQIEHVMRRIERPAAVAATIMLVMIVLSPKLRHQPTGDDHDFFNYTPDPQLVTYWTVYTLIMIYQLGFAIRMLRVLRQDPRSRSTAGLFIIAGCLGIGGILCMDIHLVFPQYVITPVAWVALCIPGSLTGVAAALSWSRRQRSEGESSGELQSEGR